MTIRVSEVIRGWLGWCPDTQMRILGQVEEAERFNDYIIR